MGILRHSQTGGQITNQVRNQSEDRIKTRISELKIKWGEEEADLKKKTAKKKKKKKPVGKNIDK